MKRLLARLLVRRKPVPDQVNRARKPMRYPGLLRIHVREAGHRPTIANPFTFDRFR